MFNSAIAFSIVASTIWIVTMFTWYMYDNWHTHTDEWRDEKFIQWLKRPLPKLSDKYRKEVQASFPSEEWENYPYCLVDAICKPEQTAQDVTKWVIYYVYPSLDDCLKDKEYRELSV